MSAAGDTCRSLLDTREGRAVLLAVLPELIAVWAGSSRMRSLLARIATPLVAAGFDPQAAPGDLAGALADPARLAAAGHALVSALPTVIRAITQALAAMAPEEREALAAELVQATDWQRVAAAAADLTRIGASQAERDPAGTAEGLRGPVRAVVTAVDFGDLKEGLEAGADTAAAVTRVVTGELWRNPAKVLCLLAAAPTLAGAGLRGVGHTLAPMAELAPDAAADVLLSLLRAMPVSELAALLDLLGELARLVHTGSNLIAEGELPRELADRVEAALAAADVERLLGARARCEEILEATEAALLDRLADHPELARELLAAPLRRRARAIRRARRRADALERVLAEEEIAALLTAGLAEIDGAALGESITDTLRRIELLARHSPDTLATLVGQGVDGIDPDAARGALLAVSRELIPALEPLAPDLLPPLLHGLAELIGSAREDPEVRRGLVALRSAMEVE